MVNNSKMANENLREGLLLGMGNPLLDISATVDDSFLKKYGLKDNDAILAGDKHKNIYKELVDKYDVEYIAGGSVQNSLRVAQWIIEKPNIATFFGAVGNDGYAKILEEKAHAAGVNPVYQYHDEEPTGTCAVLLTGKHRSLVANLAAANTFTIEHIQKPENKKLIEAAQYFYVSGFFLTVSPPSILEVAKHALANNKTFMLNLSAAFLCELYKEPMMQVMPYVDIVFGNEAEAEAFSREQNFKTTDLEEIALKICQLPKQNENRPRICFITHGNKPLILAKDGEIKRFPINRVPDSKIVDTNGAGDAFCGGFLSQYIQGHDLDVCVKCGKWAAEQILQRSGCTLDGKASYEP